MLVVACNVIEIACPRGGVSVVYSLIVEVCYTITSAAMAVVRSHGLHVTLWHRVDQLVGLMHRAVSSLESTRPLPGKGPWMPEHPCQKGGSCLPLQGKLPSVRS